MSNKAPSRPGMPSRRPASPAADRRGIRSSPGRRKLPAAAAELPRHPDVIGAVFDIVRQSLLILDGELRVEKVSSCYCQTFRVRPEEVLGRGLFELGHGQWDVPTLRARLEEVLRAGTPMMDFELDRDLPHVGSRLLRLGAGIVSSPAAKKRRLLLAIEDATDAKAAAEARHALAAAEKARDAEAQAGRLRDEFVATVSHELRGPLGSIANWVHLLSSGSVDEAVQRQGLAAIDRGIKAETRLIDDLLDASRIMARKLRLTQRPIDLVPIVRMAVESARPGAEAKGVGLQLVEDETGAMAVGDPDRLQQIVWNLLSNAIKFTGRGGQVQVSLGRQAASWQIVVKDTGQGISPEFLPHVFERFSQAEGGSARKHPGLGLGLAIVRHLVELHGGRVTAASEGEGRGATFSVRLPVPLFSPFSPRARDSAEGRGADATGFGPTVLEGLRILLVEDDADSRDALRTLLEQFGGRVTAAASAAEALASLAAVRPHLLVSDIGMPVQDGYDLIRRVRELPPDRGGDVPALALSAYASKQDRARALAAGFQQHLTKPVLPPDLVTKLLDLAARSAPR
jgi:two-component system, chemotaxis family, CheB/CheR fusion protein